MHNRRNFFVEPWPSDWNVHMIDGFKSYFANKENDSSVVLKSVQAHPKNPNNPQIIVVSHFSFKDKSYVGFFELCDSFICGEIHYIKEVIPQPDGIMDIKGMGFVSVPTGSHKVISDFVAASCEETVLATAKSVETIIQTHYWEQGGDGNDTAPLEPTDPTGDAHGPTPFAPDVFEEDYKRRYRGKNKFKPSHKDGLMVPEFMQPVVG